MCSRTHPGPSTDSFESADSGLRNTALKRNNNNYSAIMNSTKLYEVYEDESTVDNLNETKEFDKSLKEFE